MTAPNNYDQHELEKFAAHANTWWDSEGEFKTLHQINPLRLQYIEEKQNVMGLKILDVGCGGGILCEGLAKKGARVTGIDLNEKLIEVAELHRLESQCEVTYRTISTEALAKEQPATYDVVTCLEVLEHVPDPGAIVKSCSQLLNPGGKIFFSTINRNPKSYLFAIIAAEYILRMLPKNTHDYAHFIKPSELANWCRESGLTPQDTMGIHYNPFTKNYWLARNSDVNYILYAVKNT